jgi:hypothetical protein
VSDLPEEFDRSLFHVVALAERLSADWMLIGGVAVASWGRPRATADLDVALSVSTDLAEAIDRHMAVDGWVKAGGPGQIKDSGVYLVQYARDLGGGRVMGLDLFFAMSDWQRKALERRREVTFRGRTYWTATAEDLILYKLIADRGIDQADVDNVLDRRRDGLDLPYVAAWAATLGLGARWSEALTRCQDRRDLGL